VAWEREPAEDRGDVFPGRSGGLFRSAVLDEGSPNLRAPSAGSVIGHSVIATGMSVVAGP